jgi:hypothetical protein
VDRTPPPPDAPIPPRSAALRGEDPGKPVPRPGEEDDYAGTLPPPPFSDVPLVSQETPEQPGFVQAYNAVGRPRIVVFVNRTLEGELLPVDDAAPGRRYTDDRSRDVYDRGANGRYGTSLRPGQYDEADARQIDYEAIETILTDWLAAGGRTEIVSPITARQRLTDEQVKDLQGGRPRVMGEVARELDADVLVHVTARPTRQTQRGLEVRLVAEAINLGQGGQSIGRAVVDVPPPLDKPRINKFTRFLARGLMDRMTGTWENLPPPPADRRGQAPRRGDAVEDAVGEAVAPRPAQPDRGAPQPQAQPPGLPPGPPFLPEPAPADADVEPPPAPQPERVEGVEPGNNE